RRRLRSSRRVRSFPARSHRRSVSTLTPIAAAASPSESSDGSCPGTAHAGYRPRASLDGPRVRCSQGCLIQPGSTAMASTEPMEGVPAVDPAGALKRVVRDGANDLVAVEEPLEIRVDGEPIAGTMRTPGHDEELAAGL